MAIYKGTALVSQVIGKLGTLDFMRWRNKNVVRQSPPIVTDPKSMKQMSMRATVTMCGTRWRTILLPDQKAAWETYAQVYRMRKDDPSGIRQIPQGNTGNFHGLNAYILVNVKRASALMMILDDAPLARARDESITLFGAFWTPALGPLTVDWVVPIGAGPGERVRIWVDSRQELFHRQIVESFAATDLTGNILFVNAAGGASIPLTNFIPSDMIVQADLLWDDGKISHSSVCVDVPII